MSGCFESLGHGDMRDMAWEQISWHIRRNSSFGTRGFLGNSARSLRMPFMYEVRSSVQSYRGIVCRRAVQVCIIYTVMVPANLALYLILSIGAHPRIGR